MANRTVKDAVSVRGTNPQYLVEKIIRSRIYDCQYWKEECFALTAELLVDKAMDIKYVGGIYGGNVKPTPFLCLILKMLQIQPEKDIIVEFIKNEEFKYVRALGALYMRLTGTSLDCYKYLEPLLNDYRKLKYKNRSGQFEAIHVDDYIDKLLHDERMCDTILPRIQKRHVLETNNEIEPRVSALEEDLDEVDSEEEEMEVDHPDNTTEKNHDNHVNEKPSKPSSKSKVKSKRKRSKSREKKHRHKSKEREVKRHRTKSRSRSRSPKSKSRHSRSSRDDKERHRHHHSDKRKEKDRDRDKDKDKHSSKHSSTKDQEIAEANALRAKLGLAPLR